jgi:hypothetical protein
VRDRELSDSAASRSWTGRARLPSLLGAYEPVSVPSAVLKISPGRLGLRVRSAFVRSLLVMEDLTAAPADGVTIYPAREVGRRGRPGLAILAPHFRPRRWNRRWGRLGASVPPYYFLTRERDAVLAAAAAAGFEVGDEEWSIEPRDSGS